MNDFFQEHFAERVVILRTVPRDVKKLKFPLLRESWVGNLYYIHFACLFVSNKRRDS